MTSDYHSRLKLMERWYEQLADSDDRELLFAEYAPLMEFLGSLRGSVIDIGGGAGFAGRFLDRSVEYTVVDPSELWRSTKWIEYEGRFSTSGPAPLLVNAVGEDLPFPNERFDGAIAFWSLNHVRDPARCVAEMLRVLKAGGRARIIAEDMEPSWRDLLTDGAARVVARLTRSGRIATIQHPLITALRWKMRGTWPIQEDHIQIREPELRLWIGRGAAVTRREWIQESLTFDLIKR